MNILGIETSCDDTCASVVVNGKKILSNVQFSSRNIHEKYGGVFPELASRYHADHLFAVIKIALEEAHLSLEQIHAIAATIGPGLVGSLLVGVEAAKALSYSLQIPWIAVNHLAAHLYASKMDRGFSPPGLGVVLSGGHTFMVDLDQEKSTVLGTTVDDAIGEAFDKVAKLLCLPYPGGPPIEKLAKQGNAKAFALSVGNVKGYPLHFSFSGLKTAVSQQIQKNPLLSKKDLAASFQKAAFGDILKKMQRACQKKDYSHFFFGGGVVQNLYLQNLIKQAFPSQNLFFPSKNLCEDNAAMIAGLGFHLLQKNPKGSPFSLTAQPRICLSKFPALC